MQEKIVKFPLKYTQEFLTGNGPVLEPEEVAIVHARRLVRSILDGKTMEDIAEYLMTAIIKAHSKAGFDNYISVVTALAIDVKLQALYETDIKK